MGDASVHPQASDSARQVAPWWTSKGHTTTLAPLPGLQVGVVQFSNDVKEEVPLATAMDAEAFAAAVGQMVRRCCPAVY